MTREPPIVLALLRIAVGTIALVSPEPAIAQVVASRPHAMWTVPEGLGWLGTIVPLDGSTLSFATAALRVSAGLAIAGALTRISLAVLALCLLYVFGASQLTGTVTHDMHLVWFAALLAVAPSGRALSLDGWARGAPIAGEAASTESTWSVATARAWLGLVYFFPGVHKLAHGGLAWITSSNLRNQMYFKWYEAGGVSPWPRIDRVPYLVNAAAAGVVLFELAMPFLVLARRTRPWAIALGLFFHLSAGHFMGVLFPSLVACYVVLLPGDRIVKAMRAVTVSAETASRASRVALACVATTFGLAIVVQGARAQTQSYPFACYPTFATLAPDEIVDLAVDVTDDAGATATFRLPNRRRQDEWGTVWRIAGLYGDPLDRAKLSAFAESVVPRGAPGRRRVFVEAYDVSPEAWSSPPRRRWAILPD